MEQKLTYKKIYFKRKIVIKEKLFVPKIKFDNKVKLIKKLSSKNLFEELIKLNREYEFNHYKLKI